MKIGDLCVGIGFKGAIVGLSTITLSTVFSAAAIAQDAEDFPLVQGVRFGQVAHEFEDAFFSHNRDYVRNRSFTGQLKRIFGPFPENSMNRDLREVHDLYQETFFKQMNSGPILRTVDLPSPFQYSLRTLPPPAVVAPIESPPPVVITPPVAPVAPVAPAKPVPALW
ncbi:MAG: hypothetical protein NW224_06430 [Leptolyngbyaceae cyanobacterium bins.302]|nr:hypothetical protein [Leptolyngbyaceae cyanobacterium bins.302]